MNSIVKRKYILQYMISNLKQNHSKMSIHRYTLTYMFKDLNLHLFVSNDILQHIKCIYFFSQHKQYKNYHILSMYYQRVKLIILGNFSMHLIIRELNMLHRMKHKLVGMNFLIFYSYLSNLSNSLMNSSMFCREEYKEYMSMLK